MSPVTPDLFDPPIARHSDPETSHQGAAEYSHRGRDQQIMYDLIRDYPGRTAAEYSDLLRERGVHWYRAARLPTKRISDLKDAGRINVGPARRCAITRRQAQVYYVRAGV